MKIPEKDYIEMENALISVAENKFDSNYYIDKVQREIPDHLHWHARPENWEFPAHRRKMAANVLKNQPIPTKVFRSV